MRAPLPLLRLAGRALTGRGAGATAGAAPLSSAAAAPEAVAAAAAAAAQRWRSGGALAAAAGHLPGHARPLHQQPAPRHQQWRGFAAEAGKGGGDTEAAGAGAAGEASSSGDDAAAEDSPTVEQLTAELQEREKAVEELQAKVNDLADSFKRSLAEMENLRQRTSRQIANAQKFAVEPIIKSLLDVADNLQRAAESVPGGALDGGEQADAERALKLLRSLLEGVQMTEAVLMKVFQKHGVEQYNPAGEKFDPNLHQAMFEVPDPTKEAGMVAVVTKRGYRMHDRVLRAAEVGVYKAP